MIFVKVTESEAGELLVNMEKISLIKSRGGPSTGCILEDENSSLYIKEPVEYVLQEVARQQTELHARFAATFSQTLYDLAKKIESEERDGNR